MKRHFKITVKGQVQGVFYRASTKQMAKLLAVNGFVRNEPNGDVYIEAEAEEELLQKFVDWCHHGPNRAEVVLVTLTEGQLNNFTGFEVQR
jgi:acylphosphatase